jgi:uncharacterized protein (TIGR02145 family)
MRYITDIVEENYTWCLTKPAVGLGLLYNSFVVQDARGVAPTGWHIPTCSEWDDLFTYIGGVDSLSMLRCTGNDYWLIGDGTDNYGFKARGSGMRHKSLGFVDVRISHMAWASDFVVTYDDGLKYNRNEEDGCSIRLIKDDSVNPGTVTDYDGNTYTTVLINSQVWTVENLYVTHYNNGDAILEIIGNSEWANLTTGALCTYNNDWSNV